jgi:hypothetical protein
MSLFAKSDPVTKLIVYYNNAKIKELNLNIENDFTISAKNYKLGDYLAIQYFDNKKCSKCSYVLEVVSEGKRSIIIKKFKNKNGLVKIELEKLISYSNQLKASDHIFVIYLYTIDKKGKRDNGPRLLTLHIN